MSRAHFGLVGAALLATVSLAGQTARTYTSWKTSEAPAELRPAISSADVIVTAMRDALMRELKEGLARGGPATAIDSCHIDATVITQRVGRESGVAAGRTSDRLRSPLNAPKPWAAALVKEYAGRRAAGVEGFAVDLDDKVGVLRPIAQHKMCAGCHGPADRLGAGVRQVLKDQYPADHAVGFTEGEIRGWFWVEMPKSAR